jgi:uncharacterized protein YggE
MRFLKLAVLTSLSVSAAVLSSQTIQINRENKTIAISTTDEATATADIAAVTVGFEIFGSDSQGTTAEAGKLSHAILDALHKLGVEDQNIESQAQGLQKNTDFDDKEKAEQRAKEQYVFRQSWEVSASPKLAAEVINAAIAAGGNKSGAINWRMADRKALQAKAAAAALIKARQVAENMADGLHVKLGTLIYASNETPSAKLYFAPKPGLFLNTESASVASYITVLRPLEIRPQTIREEATVYAVFAIE